MSSIALNRQFFEWREGQLSDPELIRQLGGSADLLSWESISSHRRVVILAEAGSGKTAELQEQARQHTEAGPFAFYVTVEDVGRDGLCNALRAGDRARWVSWRESCDETWLFVDSIDEAKVSGIRLEKAIRRVADEIAGAERRVHVIFSCRLTDWEFRYDLERLSNDLPVPKDPVLPLPPPTLEQILVNTLRQKRSKPEVTPTENPLVVLMVPLDPDRIRVFATAKGAPNVDAFLARIEAANLWRFARRPLDLDWLVEFWQNNERLGSLAEMVENSLMARMRESNLDRTHRDSLEQVRTLQAIERIGAALVFGRKTTIAIPDRELVFPNEVLPLNLAQVLPDWTPEDRARLLTRPLTAIA